MSLYGKYIAEREGKCIVESEKGFATYTDFEDGLYIENIYVHPDFRRQNIASQMADEISLIAKTKGLNCIYGSVCPTTKGSTESLKVLLAYGFSIHSAANNFVLLKKEL